MADRILVTGPNGFIGKARVKALVASGSRAGGRSGSYADVSESRRPEWRAVRAAFRTASCTAPARVESIVVGEVGDQTHWRAALDGADCVVHLAARVHILRDGAANPLVEYRQTNVDGTLNLARQAARSGVKRFMYLSSIKVNGNASEPGRPFTEADPPAADAHLEDYEQSKLEAERGLTDLAGQTDLEVVIIRPPLVYGPGVKANVAALMRTVSRGIPLPLASVQNSRSLVGLDNLVDFIVVCASDPAAANELLLATEKIFRRPTSSAASERRSATTPD